MLGPTSLPTDADDALPLVLVAEDNADDLFFLRRLLSKAGVKNRLVTLADGAKAIDYLAGLRDHAVGSEPLACLIFLDIKMPFVTGFEVLTFVRKQAFFDDLHAVMLSSSDHPADQLEATRLGANGYFVKHPTAEALGAVVRKAIDAKRDTSQPTNPAVE